MKNKQMGDEMLFLNTPISDDSQDIIGVNTYVEKLNSAIDSGVQMIAVTSPFGSGKTSISELLEKKRNKSDEKIIKISMWSQFNGDNKKCSTNDLHRAFVYQLSSQISHKRGTYINRRLSTNYGLFKLHANKTRYWIIFILAILLLLLSQIITTFSEQLSLLLSFSENIINLLALGTTILGLVLGLIAITMSEIIFSSKQTEGKRIIESTEIIDLYRSEILGHGKSKGKCYIVIIEDLDRSSDAEAVIGFLKELRKYYVPEKGSASFKNRVIFITNVKPEALLLGEKSVDDLNNKNNIDSEINESLYAKLFDYVLNLQTINIDNYDAILEGLLQEKKEQIKKLEMPVDGRLSDLPGMKWIIRERRIGIREIKERLNIAFTLYKSLTSKFPHRPIEFEKCAVAAYLTTAFEQDFYKTDDRAFQKLINLFIQNALDNESCKQHLENTCAEYRKTVQELISIKLIDSSYRTYFYNYPKGSYLYSFEELEIINAILYAEQVPELEKIALQVSQSGSPVIHRSLDTLKQLRLPLPDSVFESETLYVETLSYSREQVMEYISHSLDYSSTSVVKTIDFFKRILTYEEKHKINNKEHAFAFCMIWETKFNEDALLQLRSMLCKEFPNEIIWYKPLFIGVHNLISEAEMTSLALMDAVSLINPDNENITVGLLKYILQRFNEEISTVQNQSNNIEQLLSSSKSYLEPQQIVPLYLEFMNLICQIIPSFEDEVIKLLHTQEENNEVDDSIFEQYQMIINKRASSLSAQTIKYISQINCYNGYNAEVAEQLYRNEYYLDYALIILHLNMNIQFEDEKIKKAILNDIEWLIEEKEYFFAIRKQLVKCESEILLQYSFMFSSDCPIMTSEELRIIQENVTNSDEIIMKLIPAELVSEDNYEMLSSYFNRKKQGNNMTMEILMYISSFSPEVSKKCFYSLDFDMIKYRKLSYERKSIIKEAYFKILDLDLPSNKIHYMKVTKCLDENWEINLVGEMTKNSKLEEAYVEVVNSSDKLTKNTVNVLCKLNTIHSMSVLVNQEFLKRKKYNYYIVSETKGKARFDLAEGELLEELWSTYIKIFSGDGYKYTRKHMAQNHDFLHRIMNEKLYEGLPEENRMQLKGIYQDKESIIDVMEYGVEFALKYYSSIAGFSDENAATAFVDIVEKSPELIASDELYKHTYDMLVSSKLKGRYTLIRKRNGYTN